MHNIKNYQAEVCRYQPKPKAEIDNDKLRLVNSSYHVKTELNHCFIIYLKIVDLIHYHLPTDNFTETE